MISFVWNNLFRALIGQHLGGLKADFLDTHIDGAVGGVGGESAPPQNKMSCINPLINRVIGEFMALIG